MTTLRRWFWLLVVPAAAILYLHWALVDIVQHRLWFAAGFLYFALDLLLLRAHRDP